MTIHIDENIPLLAEALTPFLPPSLTIERFQGRTLKREDLRDCTALCVRSTTRVNATLLQDTPVRFVGTATSGTEHVDAAYLRASGREFHDAKGCNANSVAEYVVFSILHWANKYNLDLRNKTLGVVGYGNIGRRVAELAYRLGLRLLVSDPPLKEAGGKFAPYCRNVSFDALLQESNIITNHVHYLADGVFPTVGLFDDHAFESIKPNTLFIHASRGGIVREEALWRVVGEKNIVPVVDVWEAEPRVHTGLTEHSLLATPHTAGYSYEGKINGSVMIATACCDFLERTVDSAIDADWGLFERALANNNLPVLHFGDHASIYRALRESRRLEEDTANLRRIADTPDQETRFDALRKEYPKRREILLG